MGCWQRGRRGRRSRASPRAASGRASASARIAGREPRRAREWSPPPRRRRCQGLPTHAERGARRWQEGASATAAEGTAVEACLLLHANYCASRERRHHPQRLPSGWFHPACRRRRSRWRNFAHPTTRMTSVRRRTSHVAQVHPRIPHRNRIAPRQRCRRRCRPSQEGLTARNGQTGRARLHDPILPRAAWKTAQPPRRSPARNASRTSAGTLGRKWAFARAAQPAQLRLSFDEVGHVWLAQMQQLISRRRYSRLGGRTHAHCRA